jgi:hypothetical protein
LFFLGYAFAFGGQDDSTDTTFIGTSEFLTTGPSSAFLFFGECASSPNLARGVLEEGALLRKTPRDNVKWTQHPKGPPFEDIHHSSFIVFFSNTNNGLSTPLYCQQIRWFDSSSGIESQGTTNWNQ